MRSKVVEAGGLRWFLTAGGRELVAETRPLWEKLMAFHRARAQWFPEDMGRGGFEVRMEEVQRDAEGGKVLVEILSRDEEREDPVAYSLSILTAGGKAVLEFLYVAEELRGLGLGELLARRAVKWMKRQGGDPVRVVIGEGNEEVIPFYERLGFRPRRTVLQLDTAQAPGASRRTG